MSEEVNTDTAPIQAVDEVKAPAEPSSETKAAGQEPVANADEAPKPRRRTRKPKAVEPEAQSSSRDEGTSPLPAEKPRRVTRRRKVVKDSSADIQAAESAEVLQARALAQVSQASVARKQRRAAERAAEVVAAIEQTDEAKPADSEEHTDAVEKQAVEAPKPRRRTRKAKAPVPVEPVEVAEETASAEGGSAPAAEAASVDQAVQGDAAQTEEAVVDNRPGRGARAAKAARRKPSVEKKEANAESAQQSDDGAAQDPIDDKGEDKPEDKGERKPRRSHQDRHNTRAERFGNQGDKRSRQKEQRNKRNSRFAQTEPSLSREELSGMKVPELRVKAKELELDIAGKKKAELVEEIYVTAARLEGFRDIEGILDIAHEGFGYIRAQGYMPSRDDAFVPINMIRGCGLRAGDIIKGSLRPARANDKFPGLAKIESVNGLDPEQAKRRPKFSDLTPIYPNEQLKMEHGKDSVTGRAIDIVSPIGKGQRGLIVSPPKAGKTTILKKICQSIAANNPEVHLICLLVDERPEEVTDMQRSIKGDVVASTFDMPADNHTRVAELVIERAKRIVEMDGDVVVVLDSITRLARAYNLAAPASGRILSGGVDSAALYPPKRFLGAARNIENGGSLTILASALIDTGSKMDEVIFEEFKGTGNMELKLDRDLADRRIFPAIDPVASGTRNEDLLVDETMRPFVWGLRRILANMNNTERAAASFIKGLKNTNTNQEFLIRTAKKAADHDLSV